MTIVALELLRGRVAGDTERRLAGDVLAAVVGGELAGIELARRLEPFGLAERVAAIVVAAAGTTAADPRPRSRRRSPLALREEAAPGLVARPARSPAGWSTPAPRSELFALGERVAAAAVGDGRPGVRVGVGRPVAGGDARRSFHEARCAVEAVVFGRRMTDVTD